MIEYIFLILLIIILTSFFIIIKSTKQCIIDYTLYPEFVIFIKYRNILIDEVFKTLKEPRWTDISSLYKLFSQKLSNQDTRFFIQNNYESLFTKKKTIKYFCLIIEDIILKENRFLVKNIMRLINGIPNVYNAFIMCIKPNLKTDVLSENYKHPKKILRCYIPLIRSGDSGIIVNNNVILWDKIYEENGYLIVDNCNYVIWNNTFLNRYIIIIDIFN